MEDREIVDLYWKRDEQAIRETEQKYGAYLFKIAQNILNDEEDSRECVNDTYFKAWSSMPDDRPEKLASYLSKIVREDAYDVYRYRNRKKRRESEMTLSLSELDECISSAETTEEVVDHHLLSEAISRFLHTLPEESIAAFVGRYYYADSVKDIARSLRMSEARLKSLLFRIRKKLKEYLEKEGFTL